MSQIISGFITELAVHFGRRHDNQDAEDAWLASMFKALRGFDGQTLTEAAEWFINNRSERSFPLPAECRDICHEIRSKRTIQKQASELPVGPPPLMSDARFKLADDLVDRASMSKEAARDGWIGALHNYCWEHGMLPTGRDIEKCKQAAKSLDQAFEVCVRGEGGLCNASLLALGQSMLSRREELRARILGRAA